MTGAGRRSDFDRGHKEGQQDAQLDDHEKHLRVINGSIVDNKKAVEILTLAVQQLADRFEASEKATIMLAAALKDTEETRRNNAAQAAQPVQRRQAMITVVVAVVSALTTAVGMYFAVKGG